MNSLNYNTRRKDLKRIGSLIMELIDKDALVAEINRRLEAISSSSNENNRELAAIRGAQQYELINLALFINTLKMKEVDLKKESVSKDLKDFAKEYSFNIPSDIFHDLPEEKQSLWKCEIENAIVVGAEWQKEQTINKACEFIISDIWEYLTITHCGGVEGIKIDTDRFKKDFRKAIED